MKKNKKAIIILYILILAGLSIAIYAVPKVTGALTPTVISERLQESFKKLRGKGVLTEDDINTAMREVKLALLEADVNFKVVKDFVATVKEKALGAEVHQSLNPAQQVIKIVNDELIALMGGASSKLTYSPKGFTVLMMVGLQGTGKTTTCGKLANYLKKEGKKPMLCACDIYRPAAIDQLEVVGKQTDTPVFTMRGCMEPEKIAAAAVREAELKGYNVLIVDTAGRLQIDEELMEELVRLKAAIKPHEILLVGIFLRPVPLRLQRRPDLYNISDACNEDGLL